MARERVVVNMSVPPEIYALLDKTAREKKISRSELLRRSFKQYIASEKRWQMIRAWGAESARKMNLKDERDLERIIHEYRAE